jgi:integrase
MPPASASAASPAPSRRPVPAALLDGYAAHLRVTGRRVWQNSMGPARRFLRRWPDPQAFASEPLTVRLVQPNNAVPFVTFLMLSGHLRPGYDYLLARKFTSVWRELPSCPLHEDIVRFLDAAARLGYSPRVRSAIASQATIRLLVQTGESLDSLGAEHLSAFDAAIEAEQVRTGRRLTHYHAASFGAREVLYHLGNLAEPPSRLHAARQSWMVRMAGVPAPLRACFVAYLEHRAGIDAPSTATGRATRLAHFGRFLAEIDPTLGSLAELDRRRHVEPYLAAVADARDSRDGSPISVSERRQRIIAIRSFLDDIAEWGWPEAPARRLFFARDLPRMPRPLPRYLPVDADRRVQAALEDSPNRLAADALLLQRATGLRIGELLDLELDCVHEVPGDGAWVKVPLGKLDSERMVPIDDETLALIDRIVANRSPGRPLRHPRWGRLVDFLFTHHGRRLSPHAVRAELARAAGVAGLDPAVPHQLRHTYATALVNAGCSLQALMALLGHRSAEMSLRYGRLFDATVRENYERALTLAKSRLGPVLPKATPVELETDWRKAPLIKARLAGGYCLRTPAQAACPYANICEHCPNFRTDTGFLAVLGAQRADADTLAADAESRGWGEEAARHHRLAERIDQLMARAQAG